MADEVKILTFCPKCGAQYRVPETTQGKKVRCKKCGTVFTAAGMTEMEEVMPEVQPMESTPAAETSRSKSQVAQAGAGLSSKAKGCLGCTGLFVFAVIVLCIIGYLNGPDCWSPRKHVVVGARVEAEQLVKSFLKNPSTADIIETTILEECPVEKDGKTGSGFLVQVIVEAQNDFGVKIRECFIVLVVAQAAEPYRTGPGHSKIPVQRVSNPVKAEEIVTMKFLTGTLSEKWAAFQEEK